MRCKVPAASRPRGLRATHAPPRRPEVTPAAHTDRMLQTPPDIATRSQSAGRSVNLPAAASAAPRAGTGPAGARPPSSGASLEPGSFHSSGVSLSTRHPIPCLPRGPPNPRVGPLGSALGFSAQQTGEVLAFALGFLGNSFVFSEARGAEGPFFRWKWMPTCPGGCPPGTPPLHRAGGYYFFQRAPRAALDCLPLAAPGSEPPLGNGSPPDRGQADQHSALELICCVTFA